MAKKKDDLEPTEHTPDNLFEQPEQKDQSEENKKIEKVEIPRDHEIDIRKEANKSMLNQENNNSVKIHDSAIKTFGEYLEKYKVQIAMALPRNVLTPERMIGIGMTALTRNPKLMECDITTVFGAIIQSAQLGLECDGTLGHAFLVPFYSNKRKRYEAQLIIGYQGLIELSRRTGLITHIHADIIREKDIEEGLFEYEYGSNAFLRHKPDLLKKYKDRGKKVLWYACASFTNGGFEFVILNEDDIIKSKTASGTGGKFGTWVDDPDAMEKKTAYRVLSKKLPKSTEIQRAIHLIDLESNKQEQGLDVANVDISKGEFINAGFLDVEDVDYTDTDNSENIEEDDNGKS